MNTEVSKPAQYDEHLAALCDHMTVTFAKVVEIQGPNLYKARVTYLNSPETTRLDNIFIGALSPAFQQENRCSCCMKFLSKYGDLVVLDQNTLKMTSVLWDAATFPPENPYFKAVELLQWMVEKSTRYERYIIREFHRSWGTPAEGDFNHLTVELPHLSAWSSRTMLVEPRQPSAKVATSLER